MPPLSCDHGDVSWMSQYWPSADGRRVTAPRRRATAATIAAAHVARARSEDVMRRIRPRARPQTLIVTTLLTASNVVGNWRNGDEAGPTTSAPLVVNVEPWH